MCRSVKRMASPAVDLQVLELAVDLACRAGQVAAGRFFAADFTARRKADGTEVTDADLAVEELIRAELLGRCTGDAIYGEEGGAVAGSSGRRWIIDAIDGTTYFAHRIPLFTTMLAYEDEHGPAAGVISYPVAQQMISAGRGRGCWIRTGAAAAQPRILRHSPACAGACPAGQSRHLASRAARGAASERHHHRVSRRGGRGADRPARRGCGRRVPAGL
jgi:histidinol-phosphatase